MKIKFEESSAGKTGIVSLHVPADEWIWQKAPNLWFRDDKDVVIAIQTTDKLLQPNRFRIYYEQPLPNAIPQGREYVLHEGNPPG